MDSNFPCFTDSRGLADDADGAGISVGSAISVGGLAGVEVGMTAAVALAVGVLSGTSSRPRHSDALGDVAGDKVVAVVVRTGVGCCAIALASKARKQA